MADFGWTPTAPHMPPPMVRVLRLGELKSGDILVMSNELFNDNDSYLDAARRIKAEVLKRGVVLSPMIFICRQGHEEDFFYLDEKQLNEHGWYRKE